MLEGGALRGLFTAGVLDVFLEEGLRFDGAVGVSAGACFGCNYKSHQPGRVIRYNLKYARDPRYCSWASLFKTGDLFNADFCYRELPLKLDPFDADAYAADPMEFHLSVTDCETGKAVYKKLDEVDETALKWIQASASMPLVARPVEIDGRHYLDGGLSDGIPLKYFESLGFSRNVVITTRPHGYRKHGSRKIALLRPFLRHYPAVYQALKTRHEWYNETLDHIDEQVAAGKALLICPDEPLPISRICHDPETMRKVYDLGREKAQHILPAVKNFLAPLTSRREI